MQFVVDEKLKKNVQIANRKNRKGIYNLWIIEKILLAVVTIMVLLFPVFCLMTGKFVSLNMRTGEKSYFIVIMFTSIIAGMGFTLVLLVSVVRKRIEHMLIGGRIEEFIEIQDDILFYSFRIKYQTLMDQRNVVIIDLNRINKVSYSENVYEIIIDGMMSEIIADIGNNNFDNNVKDMVGSKLKVFNYFSPSLYEFLKKYNN